MIKLSGWQPVLLILPAVILLHLYVAPYTKVEESFNIQATHDILTHGIPRSNVSEEFKRRYDHMTFPGAVPRTFIGALVLAGLSTPVLWANEAFNRQLLVRAVLGGLNAVSLLHYANSARKAFGRSTAGWYILFQASQFHIIYYASRPLPNMFALGMTTLALSLLLPEPMPVQASLQRIRLAIFLFTVTAVIFRSEIALLLFCHAAYMLIKQTARFGHLAHAIGLLRSSVVPGGIAGTLIGLCMTVPVDTYFWQSPNYLWPELSAFRSNIFPPDDSLGASAWGTQSWHWYFTSTLPRLLISPFTYVTLWLIAISRKATSESALDLLLPNLAYVAIYSFLPHKETRFIFPVIPPLTLAAALSSSYIWTRRHRMLLYYFLSILLVLSTFLSALIAHAILLPLSALSYPGAHALNALHNYAASNNSFGASADNTNSTVLIHLDNLSTQTGITRFLQHAPSLTRQGRQWYYDKSDNATDLLDPFWWTQFDYAIMESPQLAIGSWDVVTTIHGLGPIRILHRGEKREQEGLVTGWEKLDVWTDGLDMVALNMFGPAGLQFSMTARQLLREGYGTHWLLGRGWSWTGGWWVDVGWVPKLYVLKQCESLAKEEVEQLSAIDAGVS
ncbi:hypothetical protein GJ744_003216 [Endocarpon pusillum]|uniref:Mannosyltransferase n=1 Tax=Endocarpon pusillum TaxID=364733 RepID=A0A8H7AB21_9EURO|nr:hypothetical protein GJ744_003216 [Endocarpon pusillum]